MKNHYTVPLIKVKTIQEAEVETLKCLVPADVLEFWNRNIRTLDIFDDQKEFLVGILLDVKKKIIGYNIISMGSLTQSVAHPREIFKPAIAASAHSLILAHNHPTGEVDPSSADRQLTKQILDGGDLLMIPLIDHVIIGNEQSFSFRENGFI